MRSIAADPHRLAGAYLEQRGKDSLGRLMLRYWRQEWWRYKEGRSYRVSETQLRAEVTRVLRVALDRVAPSAWVTMALVSNVIQALTGVVLIPDSLDQPAWVEGESASAHCLAMSNGLLDLDRALAHEADCLKAHSPEWFSSVVLPYAFDPTAACIQWLKFLDQVLEGDKDRVALLQEWFGYCLIYDTSQQKFLVLEGSGANGKSVVLEILTGMLGEENVSHVPLEVFGDRFQLTPTLGKLANIAAEVSDCDKVAEGPLKQFIGGDRMMFDRKNLAPVHAYPTARVVIAANNPIRFADRSDGLWRRMIKVPFRVTIPPDQQKPNLAKALSQELSGILNWALEGRRRLQERGCFTQPSICAKALREHREESNPVRAFLADSCQVDAIAVVPCAEVYGAYRNWCAVNGYRPLDERNFGKEVHRAFPTVNRVRRGPRHARPWVYLGLVVSCVSHVS